MCITLSCLYRCTLHGEKSSIVTTNALTYLVETTHWKVVSTYLISVTINEAVVVANQGVVTTIMERDCF